jgi:two-component system chemotaxis response regulator CheB
MPDVDRGSRCAVAIGASAGGLRALRSVVAALPADLPAAVLIVLHLHPSARSLLPMLLASVTSLRLGDVRDGTPLQPGAMYVAVPDHHLVVADGRVRLLTSPRLHHVRPSVDRLFESVALVWAGAAVGVVLTGSGSDGAAGITAIKRQGGCTIVQDPNEAEYSGMPRAAVATGCVDFVLPLAGIGAAIVRAAAVAAAGQVA